MIEREDAISDYTPTASETFTLEHVWGVCSKMAYHLAATTLWPRGLNDQEGLEPIDVCRACVPSG